MLTAHLNLSAEVNMIEAVLPSICNDPVTTVPCTSTDKLFDVCLSVNSCICVGRKNQLDATDWFIALIICSTYFRHLSSHHQELEAICVSLPPMVCDALVAGCWRTGAGQPAMRSE